MEFTGSAIMNVDDAHNPILVILYIVFCGSLIYEIRTYSERWQYLE